LIETAKRRAPILHPLIVCAAYSGRRRGDVCRLKWSAVDLRTGELLLRTSKTGERVAIPILPPLREALAEAAANRNPGQECVWPLAARMIEENPNGLTRPFKKIAAEAAGRVLIAHEPGDATGLTPLADILPAVENRVATRYCGDKLLRMLDVLRRYAAGQSAKQIGKETGHQTARITETLRAAERWAGRQFLPDPNNTVWRKRMIAETTRRARPQGARAASVIDWHSLRTTFVTRALCGGMRVEDLQTLTGHRIVETVLKHYYLDTDSLSPRSHYDLPMTSIDIAPATKPAVPARTMLV
jgi:integrase